MKYLGNRLTDLRPIHTEDLALAGTSLKDKVKVKGQGHQGQKRHFWPFRRPACCLCLVKQHLASSFGPISSMCDAMTHVGRCGRFIQ